MDCFAYCNFSRFALSILLKIWWYFFMASALDSYRYFVINEIIILLRNNSEILTPLEFLFNLFFLRLGVFLLIIIFLAGILRVSK